MVAEARAVVHSVVAAVAAAVVAPVAAPRAAASQVRATEAEGPMVAEARAVVHSVTATREVGKAVAQEVSAAVVDTGWGWPAAEGFEVMGTQAAAVVMAHLAVATWASPSTWRSVPVGSCRIGRARLDGDEKA